jgi:hypothetical protein
MRSAFDYVDIVSSAHVGDPQICACCYDCINLHRLDRVDGSERAARNELLGESVLQNEPECSGSTAIGMPKEVSQNTVGRAGFSAPSSSPGDEGTL